MIPVTGMTLDEATKALTDMGLRVGNVKPVPSDTVEEGKVSAQSIPVYTIVMEETVVDLEVSTGMEILPPPGASESPEPSHTAEPTPSHPPVSSRKDVTVELPNDRETVTVSVTVGGVVAVPDQLVDTRLRIARFTVEGIGSQEVVVYIDGAQAKAYTEDFGS